MYCRFRLATACNRRFTAEFTWINWALNVHFDLFWISGSLRILFHTLGC